ncbi:RagB/SusD family nutrient uptake outer membrane protein [Sphingobacterium tabacisoli]|uniref:RagB/SusD family nutrient uptake outer membrane protein n=1 Tax=Sphingobacterium tabacisoli TaxID=2044855 RepID=A0ABW5L7G9_9SPHI|nr:RagB/SusD family nutrient uptake outer membrane protein [Sphingobacterium tabacisoli]
MQTRYKYILISSFIALTLFQTSCKKDFLEIEPKGYLIAKSTKDYEQILNAIYLQSSFTASGYLGDEVAAQQTYFNGTGLRMQRLFRYEDRVYQPDELPEEVTGAYSYIQRQYLFNKIINEVMDSQGGSEAQKSAILAEAKVGRAICQLMFVNDFSVPYSAATAATDLGVPVLTTADVTNREFPRATVQEVYDFMIKDLTEALPDLGPLTHRRKFSKLAAEFYLTRIYLYMGDFEKAKTHVDAAFDEIEKSNIDLALYDYNEVLADGGDWGADMDFGFGPSNKPLAANNKQTIYNVQVSTLFVSSANTFVFTPRTVSLFDASDKRLRLYSDTELFGDFVFPLGMKRYPDFFSDIGPSLPDLYLMRAEIRARTNDRNGAVSDVEFLRTNRMSDNIAVPVNIAADQQALVRFILDERIREFALNGMRWLDMRRLSVDPIYSNTVIYKHDLYDNEGNVLESFTLRPERFALKFGERMLAESIGLEENK